MLASPSRRSYKLFDPKVIGGIETYKLMTQCIVPRPIALVTTMFPDGTVNVAPYSFFAGLSSNPPTLAISVTSASAKSGKQKKDTLINVQQSMKEFVVNASQVKHAEDINNSSAEIEYGKSELGNNDCCQVVRI